MNTELERRKQEITRSQGRRKLWQRIVSALAAVVMFVTTYVLILPVEAQNRTFCNAEAHEHSAENGCYVETKTLKCDLKHEHTDECYITLLTLICQHEEHTHNKECYADKTADIETQADWEASIKAAKLTGEWSKDIIAIASTQLGYRESDKNYILGENNEIKGYNRYAAWVSSTNAEFGQYSPWSAAFVAFCLHFAKVDEAELQRTPYPAQWGELMKAYEKLNADAGNAQPGDILFVDANDDGKADRVAIVVENGDGKIKAVEGDLNNSVAYAEYVLPAAAGAYPTDRTDVEFFSENSKNKDFSSEKSTAGRTVGRIIGFVALPENPNYTAPIDTLDPENTTAEPENREKTLTLTATAENGVTVTLTADADAFDAPANELELSVSVVDDEKALALLKQAANELDGPAAAGAYPTDRSAEDFSNEKSNNSAAAGDPADQVAEDFSGEKSGETEKASFSSLILDIKVLYNKEETQPKDGKTVKITLSGEAIPGGSAQVYYLDLEHEAAENMNATLGESGLIFYASHFSFFGITGGESSKADGYTYGFAVHSGHTQWQRSPASDYRVTGLTTTTLGAVLNAITYTNYTNIKYAFISNTTDSSTTVSNTAQNGIITVSSNKYFRLTRQSNGDYTVTPLVQLGDYNISICVIFNTPISNAAGELANNIYFSVGQTSPRYLTNDAKSMVQEVAEGDNMYNVLPWATVVLDRNKIRIDNIYNSTTGEMGAVEYNSTNYTVKVYEHDLFYNAWVKSLAINLGRNYAANQTISIPGSVTIRFKDAAILPDGSRSDLLETWSNIKATPIAQMGYFVLFAQEVSGGVVDITPYSAVWTANGLGDVAATHRSYDIRMQVDGTSANDTIAVTPFDIDSGNMVHNNVSYRSSVWTISSGVVGKAVAADSAYLTFNGSFAQAGTALGLQTYSRLAPDVPHLNSFSYIAKARDFSMNLIATSGDVMLTYTYTPRISIRPKYQVYSEVGSSDTWEWKIGAVDGDLDGRLDNQIVMTDITQGAVYSSELSNVAKWHNDISAGNSGYITRGVHVGKTIKIDYNGIAGYYVKKVTSFKADVSEMNPIENEVPYAILNGTLTETITDNDQYLNVYYTPITGRVTFAKYDAQTHEPLPGAIFTMTGESSIHGQFTITAVDNGDGTYVFENVPMGFSTDEYTISETQVPSADAQGNPAYFIPAQDIKLTGDLFNEPGKTITLPAIANHHSNEKYDLTVNKTVVNGTAGKLFQFEIEVLNRAGQAALLSELGTIKVYGMSGEITGRSLTFVNGKLLVELGNNEYVVIKDIPIGYTATVEERDPTGYDVTVSGNAAVSAANPAKTDPIFIDDNKTVSYTNTRSTANLTVAKSVVGAGNGPFSFTVTFTDGSGAAVNIPQPAAGAGYTVTNNVATFDLNKDGSVTITGIPVDTVAMIVETSHNGYTVQYNFSDGSPSVSGDTAEVTITDDLTVTCINNAGFELPHTGGTGSLILTLGGVILVATALMYGISAKRRQWRAWI